MSSTSPRRGSFSTHSRSTRPLSSDRSARSLRRSSHSNLETMGHNSASDLTSLKSNQKPRRSKSSPFDQAVHDALKKRAAKQKGLSGRSKSGPHNLTSLHAMELLQSTESLDESMPSLKDPSHGSSSHEHARQPSSRRAAPFARINIEESIGVASLIATRRRSSGDLAEEFNTDELQKLRKNPYGSASSSSQRLSSDSCHVSSSSRRTMDSSDRRLSSSNRMGNRSSDLLSSSSCHLRMDGSSDRRLSASYRIGNRSHDLSKMLLSSSSCHVRSRSFEEDDSDIRHNRTFQDMSHSNLDQSSTHFAPSRKSYVRRFLHESGSESDHNMDFSFQDEYNEKRRDEEMGEASFAHDSAEWNPEVQQKEQWRKLRQAATDIQLSPLRTKNKFPQRPDLRLVDQTLNLMDNNSLQEQDRKPPTKRSNHLNFMAQLSNNMMDMWIDHTDSTSVSQSDSNNPHFRRKGTKRSNDDNDWSLQPHREKNHNNCCGNLWLACKMILAFALGGLFAALVAWKTGAFHDNNGNEDTAANVQANATTIVTTTPSPTIQEDQGGAATMRPSCSAREELTKLLESMNLAPFPDVLQAEDSPQSLALHWVARLGADPGTVLASHNHKLVHPPGGEAGNSADSDSASDALVRMTNEDCIRLVAYALAVLYFSTYGNAEHSIDEDPAAASVWRNSTNWMQPTPLCEWHGVTCEENPMTDSTIISQLNLTKNNLQGTLPQEVFQILFSLQVLDLSENHLTGSLPHDIAVNLGADDMATNSPSLEALWLHRNKLVGTLPTAFGTMTNLVSLKMFKNALEGQLPAQLNAMTSLHTLSLQENRFGGTIPYLADLRNLEVMELQSNQLVKDIPVELFSFLKLKDFRVSRNHLTGTIPPEMQSLSELRILALDNNELKGSLDDTFDHFDYLEELHLHNNKFSGKIPKSFGHLSLLSHLTLDNNKMTGTIPTELALMTELKEVRLYFNHLTGELPPEICDLKTDYRLEYLALDCQSNQNFGCSSDNQCCDECM